MRLYEHEGSKPIQGPEPRNKLGSTAKTQEPGVNANDAEVVASHCHGQNKSIHSLGSLFFEHQPSWLVQLHKDPVSGEQV